MQENSIQIQSFSHKKQLPGSQSNYLKKMTEHIIIFITQASYIILHILV